MTNSPRLPWRILAVAMCASAPAVLIAQSGNIDTGEVASFSGVSLGLGGHPVVGASTGTAFSPYGMVLFEASYIPLGQDTLRVGQFGSSLEANRLLDFNFSFHIRVPVRPRWAPYAILGGSCLWDSFGATVTGPQGSVVTRVNQYNFGFETGGGLRYYIHDNWGIRPELKVIVSSRTYVNLSVGIFYTFAGESE